MRRILPEPRLFPPQTHRPRLLGTCQLFPARSTRFSEAGTLRDPISPASQKSFSITAHVELKPGDSVSDLAA